MEFGIGANTCLIRGFFFFFGCWRSLLLWCVVELIECSQYVLGIGDATWTNFGWPRWQLVLCLALAWIIAFFCLSKGIKSAGKVVYFTALFPYVMLTAILVGLCSEQISHIKNEKPKSNRFCRVLQIRGLTLPGAGTGIQFYIQPNWSSLLNAKVWRDAASQIFYSFGLASNSLVSFASYCRVRMRPFFIALNTTASIIIINNRKCDINFTFSSVFLHQPTLTATQHSLKIIVTLTQWSCRSPMRSQRYLPVSLCSR